ncbi:unnamed protein product [Paramecium pentaurelia]|uniref:Uncharacterized protein n=1 Tax=Paramecium pentaurelia TaxID=43138 RepID=A0A8S1XLR0_9CILI|nr:unnamed protein product [Paramecium pentaurelia]
MAIEQEQQPLNAQLRQTENKGKLIQNATKMAFQQLKDRQYRKNATSKLQDLQDDSSFSKVKYQINQVEEVFTLHIFKFDKEKNSKMRTSTSNFVDEIIFLHSKFNMNNDYKYLGLQNKYNGSMKANSNNFMKLRKLILNSQKILQISFLNQIQRTLNDKLKSKQIVLYRQYLREIFKNQEQIYNFWIQNQKQTNFLMDS